MGRVHSFERRQRLERPIEEVFAAVGAHAHVRGGRPGRDVIEDRLRYSIPFGPLGELADRLLVRRDLRRIFDYCREAVARELTAAASPR